MRITTGENALDIAALLGGEATIVPEQAVAALTTLRDGVITGEGPTTRGRIHFSRTIDLADARICARILMAVGDGPVSRREAELLFEINDAALDRNDAGRFDDLFVKAVAHYALAASGCPVPPRAVALAADTPLATWATPDHLGGAGTAGAWLEQRVRAHRRGGKAVQALHALLIGAAASPLATSLASAIELAS